MVLAIAAVFSEAEGSLPASLAVGRIQYLVAVGLKSLLLCGPLVGCPLLAHWPSHNRAFYFSLEAYRAVSLRYFTFI